MCFAFAVVRAAVVGLALVGCAFAAGMMQPRREPIGPRFNIEYETVDFGNINDMQPVRVALRFTNTGDQPLELYTSEMTGHRSYFGGPAVVLAASDVFIDAATGEGLVGPRLTVHPRVYDAYINADGSCAVSIPFTNTGDMPLEIVDVIGPDL
ncbi:MAG: hypothetical protein ACK5P8_04510 [Phycisphaerae bacterium]|jgi:hypothetical protein